MERIDGVERLRVSSLRGSVAVSLDGEVVRSKPPLDYKIRKSALRVVAPVPADGTTSHSA
jgi:diacylglycerol kinase family enzyme